MTALCSTGKRMLEAACIGSGPAASEPLLKKRSSGLDAQKASPVCSNAPQPALSGVCAPGMPYYGAPCMGQPMGMGMGYMAPMYQPQPQQQQTTGSAPLAVGVPSMMPPTPAAGFCFPPFMPPPFMMMWMQQMAMHTAMACTMQKMHAQAHAQPGAPAAHAAAGASAAALAPLPYPMVMGAFGAPHGCMMPHAPMQPAMPMPAMQPHATGTCQQQQACAAPTTAPEAATDTIPHVPTPAPVAKAAPAAAPPATKPPGKSGKAGSARSGLKAGAKAGTKAGAAALAKAGNGNADSMGGTADTLLDVDFASFIDSFLLAPPGGEEAGALGGCGAHPDDGDAAHQVDLSDAMLVPSDMSHPLALSPLDDGVMDLLAMTTH